MTESKPISIALESVLKDINDVDNGSTLEVSIQHIPNLYPAKRGELGRDYVVCVRSIGGYGEGIQYGAGVVVHGKDVFETYGTIKNHAVERGLNVTGGPSLEYILIEYIYCFPY